MKDFNFVDLVGVHLKNPYNLWTSIATVFVGGILPGRGNLLLAFEDYRSILYVESRYDYRNYAFEKLQRNVTYH